MTNTLSKLPYFISIKTRLIVEPTICCVCKRDFTDEIDARSSFDESGKFICAECVYEDEGAVFMVEEVIEMGPDKGRAVLRSAVAGLANESETEWKYRIYNPDDRIAIGWALLSPYPCHGQSIDFGRPYWLYYFYGEGPRGLSLYHGYG